MADSEIVSLQQRVENIQTYCQESDHFDLKLTALGLLLIKRYGVEWSNHYFLSIIQENQPSLLSLGCGARSENAWDWQGADQGDKEAFEAHIFRVASALGMPRENLVGYDYFPQNPDDSKRYKHRQANLIPLLQGNNLIIDLDGRKFTFIDCELLFKAPIKSRIALFSEEHVINLKQQSLLLLEEEGIISIDGKRFQLREGKLVSLNLY